jgi:hypothetical protein
MRVLVFLMHVVLMLLLICCITLVIKFGDMFFFNLASIQQKRANDTWLRARCKEPVFLYKIRHHLDLCETVEIQAQTNAFFVAIQQTWGDECPWLNRRTALSCATRMHTSTTYETNPYYLLIKHTIIILRREIRRLLKIRNFI